MASTVRTKARSPIHEFDLIQATPSTVTAAVTPSVIRGIGDDAAVITSRAGQWTVLTTDLLTEGVHFDLRTATMADIGFRAAAANLSDIAAMGGTHNICSSPWPSPAPAPAAVFSCTEG